MHKFTTYPQVIFNTNYIHVMFNTINAIKHTHCIKSNKNKLNALHRLIAYQITIILLPKIKLHNPRYET